MATRPGVSPLRKSIALIAVLLMLLSACSSGSNQEVAKVGDTVITEQDLAELYDVASLPVDEQLRSTVFALIAKEVLLEAMQVEFGTGLDGAKVQEVYDRLIGQMEANNLTPADFLGLPGAGLGMIRFDSEIAVVRDSVMNSLVAQPDYVDALFANPAAVTTVCAKHILVATEEEALAVRVRLEAGEDFTAVATEVSLDTGSEGGDLGCQVASAYVEPFAATTMSAPLDELTGPFQTDFGWHVVVVSDRTAPTREEILADPTGVIPSEELSALWREWFNAKLQAATVELDPKYGTWSAVGIIPPGS
ncbi:MAG: hypothetical protein A2Z12_04325 [Actinobacteria bacterium RBG_16_68_21]|nr:MAG: hypothetical protein A2Z12_04325 [Actinobacteria bacterium RBG_16_68_21]